MNALTLPPPVVATRILGVDPGLRITGFGVIEKTGNKLSYLASGCIKTDAKASLPQRLGTIHSGLRELVAQYQPDQAVVEIVFVNVNPQSTLLLGQARGAVVTQITVASSNVPVKGIRTAMQPISKSAAMAIWMTCFWADDSCCITLWREV